MNYYDILNVSPDSSLKEINKSFKQLSLRYHPDLNPDDRYSEERMKIISEAYTTLSNYEKRIEYDQKIRTNKVTPFSFSGESFGLLNAFDELFSDHFSLTNNDSNTYSKSVQTTSVIEDGVKKTKKIVTENGNTYVEEFSEPISKVDKLTFF